MSASTIAINKEKRRMVSFSDQKGIIHDKVKKFVGSTANGRVAAISEGRLNELMGGNIGVTRLMYLALHELDKSIESGKMTKEEIFNILKDSGLGLF